MTRKKSEPPLSDTKPWSSVRPAKKRGVARYTDSTPAPPPGAVTLRPRQGPRARAAGAGLVAILWNGLVGVVVAIASRGWLDGEGSLLLSLLLFPFVLVGLGLFWAFVGALRSLGAPRPALTLEPARVPLGGTACLAWAFEGRTPSVEVLRVTLEGSEEAISSRGPDRVTDRALFHRSDVVLVSDPREAVAGTATVSPPAASVPTLSAPSNRVVWLLRLTAKLRGHDDVREEYEFAVVAPEPPAGGTDR